MSHQLDLQATAQGTRFRIFPLPRYAKSPAFKQPEVVAISVPPQNVQAGPADDRFYVIDAKNKPPYTESSSPPYTGAAGPKVKAGDDGHFDRIDPNSRDFLLCTMYATVRRVLDIWEDYLGRTIQWHFVTQFARMELVPLINWDNAHSGFGFLEFGYGRTALNGIDYKTPYCENFDVLAHEMGHSIIFAVVSTPAQWTPDFAGFHESAGDLVAIVALLHFNSVIDHLLDQSHGDLFTVNELTRIGELSASRQIRLALNYLRMSDVGAEAHDRSQPLTGAFFDIFVEIFQRELVSRNLITPELAAASLGPRGQSDDAASLQKDFDQAYAANRGGFKDALIVARDEFGRLLARVWPQLIAEGMTYADVARVTLAQDALLTGGKNQDAIRASFLWREITVPMASPLRAIHRVVEPADPQASVGAELLGHFVRRLGRGEKSDTPEKKAAPSLAATRRKR